MTLTNTLYTGLQGLTSNGDAIAVIGDNISNMNTVGFRQSRAVFEATLSRSIVGVGEIGAGSRVAKIEKVFTQGAIVSSPRSTDMAISGRGFFVVAGRHEGQDGSFYTRAGEFSLNEDGYLVNSQGLIVQGYQPDSNGNITATLDDLYLDSPIIEPKATSNLFMGLNLEADAEIPANPFDKDDPVETSNFSTSVTMYDSRGDSHDVTVYFNKTATGWDWHAVTDGAEVNGGTEGVNEIIADGSLTFTGDGLLDTEVTNSNSVDWDGATASQTIDFDFGDSITTDGGTGVNGATSYATESSLNKLENDGYPTGTRTDVEVDHEGIITILYSNGESRQMGQVAVADFRNEVGLQRIGSTMFAATPESGDAQIGYARTGGRGSVKGAALENSNVDLSSEFVTMITSQRAYQASTKTITTADEMTVETLNIKR